MPAMMLTLLLAVIAAIGLMVLMFLYLNKISDGDLAAFLQKIMGMTAEIERLSYQLKALHGGEACPERRSRLLWVRRCANCERERRQTRKQALAIVRTLPTGVLVIGYVAYYSRWFIHGPEKRK